MWNILTILLMGCFWATGCIRSNGGATVQTPTVEQTPATEQVPTSMPEKESKASANDPEDSTMEPDITSKVPCKTEQDCWIQDGQPVARPAAHRGRKFEPCVDGEIMPVCVEGMCGGLAYGC